MKKIAVFGYGTVGSGVVEVLETNREAIGAKAGDEIEVKYILELKDFPGTPIEHKIVHDVNIILEDPEIVAVVEVMGGVEPAYTFTKRALLGGKSVITSNKALVAAKGAELLDIAREKNINFLFEASVGGGIPIIRPLNSSLTADKLNEITGILNGTTNFILTEMSEKGSDFETALAKAQSLGYAERDPSADVDGWDACRKIAILSSIAFGKNVDYEKIYTEGIRNISDIDFKYAKALDRSIKLLATSRNVDDNIYIMVSPVMISKAHPLYNVNGVINGINVNGNMVGDVMFVGAGAGKLPTASAVVSDIVDAIKHEQRNIAGNWTSEELVLSDINESVKPFFVRIKADVSVETVEEVFGKVSVVSVKELGDEYGFVTEPISEAKFEECKKSLPGIITRIRMGQ